MKLSLTAATITTLSLLHLACGVDDRGEPRPRSQPTEPAAAPAAAAPEPRKLVAGSALPTSPVNLIADPGFGLTGRQAGFGSFLAFDEASFAPLTLATTTDSRSPAGFGGAVALVRAKGATDKASAPMTLLTSFQGGAGPFVAKVWVSKSNVTGAPAELTIDEKGIRASVTDGTPDGEAFDLTRAEGATRLAGGRTWTLLRAEVREPLAYGGFFVIHAGSGGGWFHVAAPEIVAQPLVDGLASTRSLAPGAGARARTKAPAERTAIARYQAQQRPLVPAE